MEKMDKSEIAKGKPEENDPPHSFWDRFTKASMVFRGAKATPVLSFVRFLLVLDPRKVF